MPPHPVMLPPRPSARFGDREVVVGVRWCLLAAPQPGWATPGVERHGGVVVLGGYWGMQGCFAMGV